MKFDIVVDTPSKRIKIMTEDQENKLIIAYLQDVIAQMTAYKEYKLEYDEMVKQEEAKSSSSSL